MNFKKYNLIRKQIKTLKFFKVQLCRNIKINYFKYTFNYRNIISYKGIK